MERAIHNAFNDVLDRRPNAAELKAFKERLVGTSATTLDACYDIAVRLVTLQVSRAQESRGQGSQSRSHRDRSRDFSPDSRGDESPKRPSRHRASVEARDESAAVALFKEIFGRSPGDAFREVLRIKAETDTGVTRAFLEELYDQSARASSERGMDALTDDPLYKGLMDSQGVENNLKSRCIQPAPPGKAETALADYITVRNRQRLLVGCNKASSEVPKPSSKPKEDSSNSSKSKSSKSGGGAGYEAGGCLAGGACGDGTQLISRSMPIRGTPLSEAQAETRVGSIMPRFVYAEYYGGQ